MLTDIFADRYEKPIIWQTFSAAEAKLLVQCFRIVSEQVCPFYTNEGKELDASKKLWERAHAQLSMELGLEELWQSHWFTAQNFPVAYAMEQRCKFFVTAQWSPESGLRDRFMKERLSFIELMFRLRGEEISSKNASLAVDLARARVDDATRANLRGERGLREAAVRSHNVNINAAYAEAVSELNERFRRADVPLNYHNGFIQITADQLTEKILERPFWSTVADPRWKNVDTAMKEAIDKRDRGDRDSAFSAACALESTIKIISEAKGWTRGNETGAAAYIGNLASNNFIAAWEQDLLKAFFSKVRNPLGHGPGPNEMPELTPAQNDWAIETCMSWVRSLVNRLKTA